MNGVQEEVRVNAVRGAATNSGALVQTMKLHLVYYAYIKMYIIHI